jgi:acetyltransferase-like isoleucine patch superfamily enzyme
MITFKEIVRRAIQFFSGSIILDLPYLLSFRIWLYRLLFPIGKNCIFAHNIQFIIPHTFSNPNFEIGNFVEIGPSVIIDYTGGVAMKDHVWISEEVMIFTHDHIVTTREFKKNQSIKASPLVIEEDSWIGARSIILPNVQRIGKGAIIGAGSIVTQDVDDYLIVAGNPVKVIGRRI